MTLYLSITHGAQPLHEHFVLRCDRLIRKREVLMKGMIEVLTGFEQQGDEEKVLDED